MKKGGVVFQVLAIYVETKKRSSSEGAKQFSLFKKLIKEKTGKPIRLALSIENGSAIFDEEERLELGFQRLEKMIHEAGSISYISMTHNTENRFGGGNESKVGLKRDGEILLEYLDGKNIAIDFSHTSDKLAHDIFNYLDRKKLNVRSLASHSNFRKALDVERNLPDDIALELTRRKGVIGLNFIRFFIGKQMSDILKHIEHALALGLEKNLGLGADFVADVDVPPKLSYLKPLYFPQFDNSSCYPQFLQLLREKFPEELIQQLAHKNLESFLDI
jgi:microsomal dipeptidase-like Zn-dependent dipeptidase